jgi:hypothetical protein
VVSTTPRPPYPRGRPGTHCTGGWVGSRAGLDVREKSSPHWDFFLFLITGVQYRQCRGNKEKNQLEGHDHSLSANIMETTCPREAQSLTIGQVVACVAPNTCCAYIDITIPKLQDNSQQGTCGSGIDTFCVWLIGRSRVGHLASEGFPVGF